MNRSKLIYALIGLVAGFLIGFAFTNTTNRRERDEMRAELARLRSNTSSTNNAEERRAPLNQNSPPRLTDEEIRGALTRADSQPQNVSLQRTLGRGLYLYARETENAHILPEAVRILKRAYELDTRDYETTVLLGNALFDTGQTLDPSRFAESRVYYLRALEARPDDVNVRTDLGLSYFYDRPSDPERAIEQYRRSLRINPRHEATLQNLAAALISINSFSEAEEVLQRLQSVNSTNAALTDLRAQLAQSRNAAQERN